MMTVARARELIGDTSLTEYKVNEIRDALYALVELAYETWRKEKLHKNERSINEISHGQSTTTTN